MTFDQWWATLETREQHRADKALTEEAFTAGAASRDAEVAELDSNCSNALNNQQREFDDLQALNAELVAALEFFRDTAICQADIDVATEALAKVRKP